jgi:DNA-binding transcriptional LysR family regulator
MTDWQDLRYFAALAEAGSLSAAARSIGVEHATIARRIAALETDMGVKLVDRRGRRLILTAEGAKIAVIAARMKVEAQAVDRVVALADSLSAEVTISAPPAFANAVLVEPLAQLRKAHPGLFIRVIGERREASLDRREADIAIRLRRPDKGDFIMRKIGDIAFSLYGSPDYLAATHRTDWDFIAYDEAMDDAPQQAWLRECAGEKPFAIRARSLEMQRDFAVLGCGVALLPDFMIAAGSTLVQAAGSEPPFLREVWLAVHSDMKNAPAIRIAMAALEAIRLRA